MPFPTREDAWNLLCEYTTSDPLRKHGLGVEAAMRAYARRFGEDGETWGIVGLLHDFDYERWPQVPDHPLKGNEILVRLGYPEEICHAILCHAEHTQVERESLLDRTIFATDELVGFIVAVALVRPTKDIRDVKVSSIRKKWKEKAFAAAVKREDVERGCAELGIDLWEHAGVVLEAMQGIAGELGLDGSRA